MKLFEKTQPKQLENIRIKGSQKWTWIMSLKRIIKDLSNIFLSLKVIMHTTKTYNKHQRCKVESWQDTEEYNTKLAGNEKSFKATTQANPHQL